MDIAAFAQAMTGFGPTGGLLVVIALLLRALALKDRVIDNLSAKAMELAKAARDVVEKP